MRMWHGNRRRGGVVLWALLLVAALLAPAAAHADPPATTGTPWAWGWNYRGQLGNGTIDANASTAHSVPSQIALSTVTGIAGQFHGIAARQDGSVWAWGDNSHGQMGTGAAGSPQPSPAPVPGLIDVVQVAAGSYHSVALKSDGTVWTWGWNNYGQLGDGTLVERHTPVAVVGLSDVVVISAGSSHNLALKSDGTVWAWGSDFYGELGDGQTTHRTTPVQVTTSTGLLSGVSSISAGGAHSLALRDDGTVWAWGWNRWGQIGNGNISAAGEKTATPVSGLSDVRYISGGGIHSLAVKSDGSAWSWGNNTTGALANGTVLDSAVPMQVVDTAGAPSYLSDIISVAGGQYHSMALKADGTVYTWGENIYGELGNVDDAQTLRKSYRPLLVHGLTDVVALAGTGFTPYVLQRTMRPPWDVNSDHVVDIADVALIGLHWLENGSPGWLPEDVNADGVVDIGDIAVIGAHWLETW